MLITSSQPYKCLLPSVGQTCNITVLAGAHSSCSVHKLLGNMPPEEVPTPLQQVNFKLGYQGCLCLALEPLLLQILLQLAGLALVLRHDIPELGDIRIELPVAVLQQTFTSALQSCDLGVRHMWGQQQQMLQNQHASELTRKIRQDSQGLLFTGTT